ncbi:MAG TPA: ProQ/FinO family protein [Terriglobia bacterium]|nr:ProQ/FinO family protein [Terriglobia bacterium]
MTDTDKRKLTYRDRKLLAEAFPACFVKPGIKAPKRPLRIGIEYEIQRRGGVVDADGVKVGWFRLKRALADYCNGRRYQEALIRDDVRIDIDGNPAGPVTPEAKELARARLAEIVSAAAAKSEQVAA